MFPRDPRSAEFYLSKLPEEHLVEQKVKINSYLFFHHVYKHLVDLKRSRMPLLQDSE